MVKYSSKKKLVKPRSSLKTKKKNLFQISTILIVSVIQLSVAPTEGRVHLIKITKILIKDSLIK